MISNNIAVIRVLMVCIIADFVSSPLRAAQRQFLSGHVPKAALLLQPIKPLTASSNLDLVIGLPLHNRQELTNLLAQVYDPASANFHQFLSPDEFTSRFAPSETDYQAVVEFLKTAGLTVKGTHPNRTTITVRGTVGAIESVFHTRLREYEHPYQSRTFFAPDVEPSLDFDVPVLAISGLDNFQLPYPKLVREAVGAERTEPRPRAGSGPAGSFMGMDFRNAYVPGSALNGSGQVVGLLQFDGYYAADIAKYEAQAGLPSVPLQNILLDGYTGLPSGGVGTLEVSLDIEMAISMAPGLRQVTYYGGFFPNSILTEMAHPSFGEPLPMQISDSWGYPINAQTVDLYLQISLQGQSYFNASGDDGAYAGAVASPDDVAFITVVGGTILSMTNAGAGWASEIAWSGSGGGFSTTVPIPAWQLGLDMSANQGSTLLRNLPDVAMVASGVYVLANNGKTNFVGGTSVAAPLWGGFTALINQQAAARGKPTIGFLNPAIYAIGKSTDFALTLHDITIGNNTNSASPTKFFAVPGYDLCTGWGTPKGANLINALQIFTGQIWVEFGRADSGLGTFDRPFNLLEVGVSAVQPNGTIFIKSSSGNETLSITKPLTLRSYGGNATVGR